MTSLITRLLKIDKKLSELRDMGLNNQYQDILKLKGPKLYLKINSFEKQIGLQNETN